MCLEQDDVFYYFSYYCCAAHGLLKISVSGSLSTEDRKMGTAMLPFFP